MKLIHTFLLALAFSLFNSSFAHLFANNEEQQQTEQVSEDSSSDSGGNSAWLHSKIVAPLVVAKAAKAVVLPLVIAKKVLIGKKLLLVTKAAVVGKALAVARLAHGGEHPQLSRLPTVNLDNVKSVVDRGSNVLSEGINLAGAGSKVASDTLQRIGNRLQDNAVRVQALNGLVQSRISQHQQIGLQQQPQQQQIVDVPEPQFEQIVQQQQVHRLKRDTNSNPRRLHAELQRLLRVVRQNKAEGCLQRVFCELSVDRNVHGAEGVKFGDSILKQFGDYHVPETAKYRSAANVGTQFKSLTKCSQRYESRCHLKSIEVISMGNSVMAIHS